MLVDLGCAYTVVGHSERRALFGESDEFIARKAEALLGANIRPIVCVGETLEQREAGNVETVIGGQLEASLALVPKERSAEIVVAYEPVWAIGTGKTATPEMAQEVHSFIREQLRGRFAAAGDEIRIQYGGSVKPDNVAAIMAEPDIDGALVGGASLDPKSFSEIVSETIRIDRRETPAS
jgi:triosephosphate isomerase